MANHYPFYIVDVFAEQRYNGNQLLVLRGNPSAEMMQVIAKEIGFSETTFITSDELEDGGYNVRIFTTASELPFAGHPTLGTAYIIRRAIIQESVEQVVLNLGVGPITVTFSDDGLVWMRQNPAVFGHAYSATAMADVLGLKRADMDDQFPVEEVSTGMPFIIVPLKTLAAVKRARVHLDKFRGMIEGVHGLHADAILVFCPETYYADNHLNVRVFVDFHGAPEDAATGSANGCLAAYLAYHEYFGSHEVNVRVEQGYEIERPSLLYLHSTHMDGESIANVGGKVIVNARGNGQAMNPKEEASVQQQFGSVAAHYSTSAVHAKGQDLALMVQSVTLTGTERVLDAGCGAGHTALAFAPHVAEVVAYDLTPAMLEQVEQLAAKRAIENVTVWQGDVEKLPFPDESFDLVVSRYSAHHWPHPVTALREFARVLKPGCPFVLNDVVAPDDLTQDTFLQTIGLLRDPSHVRDHTVRQWLAMIDEAGFHYPEVFSSWDLYLDFASWVKRTATPPECVTMIQGLFNIIPDTIITAMRVQPDYSFTIQAALIHTTT